MNCLHCGEKINFFKVSVHELAQDHPLRGEVEISGGWWVHSSGPAAYLRMCAFRKSPAESEIAYLKFRDAQATPDFLGNQGEYHVKPKRSVSLGAWQANGKCQS